MAIVVQTISTCDRCKAQDVREVRHWGMPKGWGNGIIRTRDPYRLGVPPPNDFEFALCPRCLVAHAQFMKGYVPEPKEEKP